MRKICPKCHRVQQDERIIACELCKEPYVSMADGIRLLSNEEISALASAIFKDWRIKLLLRAFPVVVIVGVAAAALFLNWSAAKRLKVATAEIERTSSNEVARALSAATNQMAFQFRSFAYTASNQVIQAYSTVTNQIAEQFQTPRIKQTVESVAKGEAKSILEAEVQPAVTSFKEDALFMRTIARAQGYDFKAYQYLLEIEKGTNENAKIANQVLDELDRSLARDRSDATPKRVYLEVFGTNIYKGPFASDELVMRFPIVGKDRTSFNREGFVNTIGDMRQPLFLPQLVALFTNETDLGVADRLTIAISDSAKEDFHPRDYSRITTWWKNKQDSSTNWPFAVFELGLNEFSSTHYAAAAAAFQQVLELDSGADMSRAFAIACYWETGETNQAATLAKEFKNPAARWAQWASAKAELEGGSISNATVHFANITTSFPSMLELPSKGSHIYRKIDWQLFDKLVGTNAP